MFITCEVSEATLMTQLRLCILVAPGPKINIAILLAHSASPNYIKLISCYNWAHQNNIAALHGSQCPLYCFPSQCSYQSFASSVFFFSRKTGILVFGPRNSPTMRNVVDSLSSNKIAFQNLTGTEVSYYLPYYWSDLINFESVCVLIVHVRGVK